MSEFIALIIKGIIAVVILAIVFGLYNHSKSIKTEEAPIELPKSPKMAVREVKPKAEAEPSPYQSVVIPPVKIIPTESLSSLKDVSMPTSVTVTESISLLSAEGKETAIPLSTVIEIEKRSDSGTLTMKINGALFVGNESRLAGKVKLP